MKSTMNNESGLNDQVRKIILKAETSADVFKAIYQLRKAEDKKYSLSYFCKKAKIPSTGYLSDVIQGRKTLHLKYTRSISSAFGLKGNEAKYVGILIAIDNESNSDALEKLHTKKALLKKDLNVSIKPMSSQMAGLLSAVEVFCAFGLFNNRPTVRDLQKYFGPSAKADVKYALDALRELGIVELSPEGQYTLLTEQIQFREDMKGFSHIDFLKQAIRHATQNVEQWFPHSAQTHFESSIISVRAADYHQLLPDLKSRLSLIQSGLESGQADTLIRFNIQVYPIGTVGLNK